LTPSKLCVAHDKLILDASVLINLLGTGRTDSILKVLNRVVTVDEIALTEVTVDPSTGKSPVALLGRLQATGLIQVIRMDDEVYSTFIELTGAVPPDDLDDGEAATLAQALHRGYVPVVDEKKAMRIARIQFPEVTILNSLDLLAAPEQMEEQGQDIFAENIYLALHNARMRVLPTERPWVIQLLGNDRVVDCPSLGISPTACGRLSTQR
jgi:predicted nucleic acid-binding protein